MNGNLIFICIILFLVTFLGGLAAMIRRWSDEFLHLLLSFGAGIFLGATFLHLLPETLKIVSPERAGIFILIGYLALFLTERVFLSGINTNNQPTHQAISMTVLIGLSIHSLIEGFGLAVINPDSQLGRMIFISILAHKLPASIALVSLMALGKHSYRQIVSGLLLFALMAPAGALILTPLIGDKASGALMPLTALVTGSFLYVSTADMLPEVFHTKHNRVWHLVLLIFGIITMILVTLKFKHMAH